MKILYILLFIVVLGVACEKESDDMIIEPPPPTPTDKLETETFTFLSDGKVTEGKIYLPDSYDTNKNLPAIYLIDFQERGTVAGNEFIKVVEAVKQILGFDALVITLEEHLDIHSQPEDFQDYYTIFKDMSFYVDSNFTNNTSRTFIARGGEAGIVIMALFLENSDSSIFENFIATDSPVRYNQLIISLITSGNFPQDKGNKKFHFSFSDSNDFDSCTSMINKINEAKYPWMQFESVKYRGPYTKTYPKAFVDGIKFVFN